MFLMIFAGSDRVQTRVYMYSSQGVWNFDTCPMVSLVDDWQGTALNPKHLNPNLKTMKP